MKIERKITFVVCGVEFHEMHVAKFFQTAIKRDMQINGNDNPQISVNYLLHFWGTSVHHTDPRNHAAEIVSIILNLQLPKAPRKEKPIAPNGFNFDMIPEEDNPPN